MIVSLWKKNDRFNSLMVYGLLAHRIFLIIENSISNTNTPTGLTRNVNDPTGLLKLLVKVFEVICLGMSKLSTHIIFIT